MLYMAIFNVQIHVICTVKNTNQNHKVAALLDAIKRWQYSMPSVCTVLHKAASTL
jgi:hypothetical protein